MVICLSQSLVYNINIVMKSTIYTIFIGVIVMFFALLLYVPDETVLDTAQVQDLGASEVVVVEDVEVSELEPTEEEPEILIVEEEVEVVVDLPAEVVVEQPIAPEVEEVEEKIEELPQVSFTKINEVTRKAIVNIFCTTKSGGSFKPTTGSGVIIDERGVILTNAHVAQYFLLENYLTEGFINCVIRTGSPAIPLYKAKLIFISPSWVNANANNIIQQSPKGTGEDDYALLLITERTDPTADLPESFSFIEPLYNSGSIETGDGVLLAGYPAGFLSGITIAKNLYISSAITSVMELFTFRDGTLDLFSIGGSVVAQQGSSGGAVVDTNNRLLGVIVTSSVADATDERDLRAITIAHINRRFVKDTGFDLQTLFSGNMEAEVNAFEENLAPALTQLLADELDK